MVPIRKRPWNHELPAWGVLAVILGALAVAGLGVVAKEGFGRARQRAHLQAAMPKLQAELSQQRQILVEAIEAYKRILGVYPPDHLISTEPQVVDSVTNQLLYELLGAVYDAQKDMFLPPHFPAVSGSLLKTYFNTNGLRNAVDNPALLHEFLATSNLSATVAVHNKPDVALLGYFPGWEGIDPDLYQQIELSSWRYNSSCPTHNRGRYDLWIEVRTSQTNLMVGNW